MGATKTVTDISTWVVVLSQQVLFGLAAFYPQLQGQRLDEPVITV